MFLILKLAALGAFLGGPLLLMDEWRSALGAPLSFALGFAPLGLLMFGMLSIDDEASRARTIVVRLGVSGALLLLVQNAIALARITTRAHDQYEPLGMYALGIAMGTAVAAYYLVRVRRGPPSSEQLVASAQRVALVRDWLLLAISGCFVLAGITLLRRSPATAIVTILFFGACGIVPVSALLRRRRTQDHASHARALLLPPDRTLRPLRGRAIALFGGMLGLGLIIFFFSASYTPLFRALVALVAAFGACGLVAIALGYAPVGYLRFDALHLTIGRRGHEMHVPWAACALATAGEYMNNPVVLVYLDDTSAVHATPPERTKRAHDTLASNERWVGAPIMIITSSYGFDPEVLASALQAEIASVSREP